MYVWYIEVRNKEYHKPRICPRAWRLLYDSGDEREQQIISRAIDNSGSVPLKGV